MKNNNKGFSLVELIVVIAIMAILAAIAIPTFAHFITKANEASDAELLHNINYIFNASCVENGVDIKDVTAATWNKTEKKVEDVSGNGISDETAEKIEASFVLHFGDMTEEEFKYITDLYFDAALHEFVDLATASEITLSYGDKGTITISRDQLDALKNSAFGSLMDSDELLGKVDYVTGLAASLMSSGETNSTFAQMIMGADYGQILAENLGVEYGTDEFVATVDSLLTQTAAKLVADNPDKYDETEPFEEGYALYDDAYYQIVANNAVLNAAQNSDSISNNILGVLGSTNSKGQIVDTINTNSGEGLAQASAAYALYTAYAERTGKTVSDNPADVLLAMDNDQGFKDYINNVDGNGYAQADLNGYLASMGMINNNIANNTGAVSDILVNGFANDDLVGMLGQATGN